jgi:outer membrane lipoprotein-sorting protein
LSACCGTPIRPPDNGITDPVELLNVMSGRLGDLHSARFSVVTEYYGPGGRGANFRQAVLVRAPEDLHVQVISPFGTTLSVLVSNGQTLSLWDQENEVFYSGSPSPRNIARMLPFYMTAADIVRVLLGGPPLDQIGPNTPDYELEWDGDEGRYRLTLPLPDNDGRLELGVRHNDWTVESARRFDTDGELVFELRTGDPQDVGDTVLPMQLRFMLYGEIEIDMSMEVESAEVNVDLPDSLFELDPPRGVEQINLDD